MGCNAHALSKPQLCFFFAGAQATRAAERLNAGLELTEGEFASLVAGAPAGSAQSQLLRRCELTQMLQRHRRAAEQHPRVPTFPLPACALKTVPQDSLDTNHLMLTAVASFAESAASSDAATVGSIVEDVSDAVLGLCSEGPDLDLQDVAHRYTFAQIGASAFSPLRTHAGHWDHTLKPPRLVSAPTAYLPLQHGWAAPGAPTVGEWMIDGAIGAHSVWGTTFASPTHVASVEVMWAVSECVL